MRKVLAIGNDALALNWDDEAITPLMNYMFHPWNSRREDSSSEISIESGSSNFTITSPGKKSCSFEKGLLVTALEQTITERACEFLKDFLQIHAAVIDFNGAGVMISGHHGAGKTTLALTSLAHGWGVLTDEVAIIASENNVTGMPRPLRVLPDIVQLVPSIIPENCPSTLSSDGITHLHFYSCGPDHYKSSTTLRYLFFPVRHEGDTILRELGESEAITRLLTQGFNFNIHGNKCLDELPLLIRNIRSFEIQYRDHHNAISSIEHLINT